MHPRLFDLVMANPPYSAHWDNQDRESDPRWANYGVAPKSKADYAFLLHCLYHLNEPGQILLDNPELETIVNNINPQSGFFEREQFKTDLLNFFDSIF